VERKKIRPMHGSGPVRGKNKTAALPGKGGSLVPKRPIGNENDKKMKFFLGGCLLAEKIRGKEPVSVYFQ